MSNSEWIGKSIGGRCQVEGLLRQGGISSVYKANDPNLRRGVAVKMIHRDLKPANVMLNIHGEVILMDFGIGKIIGGQHHTATARNIKSRDYFQPICQIPVSVKGFTRLNI